MQFICGGRKKLVLDLKVFDFSQSAFSRQFMDKPMGEFVEILSSEISKSRASDSDQISKSTPSTSGDISFEFDEESSLSDESSPNIR